MFKQLLVVAAVLAFAFAAPAPEPRPGPSPVPKADPALLYSGYVAPVAYTAPVVSSYVYPSYYSGLVYV